MDSGLRTRLVEIFGGNMNVAPGGTGAVLIRPSKLSLEVATQSAQDMDLDGVCRDVGAVAARALADTLESRNLRPADYAGNPDLPKVVASRVARALSRSEEFSRSFSEHLSVRG